MTGAICRGQWGAHAVVSSADPAWPRRRRWRRRKATYTAADTRSRRWPGAQHRDWIQQNSSHLIKATRAISVLGSSRAGRVRRSRRDLLIIFSAVWGSNPVRSPLPFLLETHSLAHSSTSAIACSDLIHKTTDSSTSHRHPTGLTNLRVTTHSCIHPGETKTIASTWSGLFCYRVETAAF